MTHEEYPIFSPYMEGRHAVGHCRCRYPNYRGISVPLVLSIALLFMVMQLLSYYCMDIVMDIVEQLGIDKIHSKWCSSLTNLVMALVINTVFYNKHERTLIKCACITSFLGHMLTISFYSLYFLYSVGRGRAAYVATIVYAFVAIIVTSVSISFQYIGCFCYMIYCIPRSGDKGLITALFLTSVIMGQNLYHSLQYLDNVVEVQVIVYVGAAINAILTFSIHKLLPIVSFGQYELSLNLINQLLHSGDKPHPPTPQRKCESAITWLRFYIFFLFYSKNGAILSLYAFLLASTDQTIRFYHQLKYCSFVKPQCSDDFIDLLPHCWPEYALYQYINVISMAVQLAALLILGYIFDLAAQTMSKYRVLNRMFAVYAMLMFYALMIPGLVTIETSAFRALLVTLLMVEFSLGYFFVFISIVTMFKGGYRVAICMACGFIYLFSMIFDLLYFVNGFIGSGYFELVEMMIMGVLYCLYSFT